MSPGGKKNRARSPQELYDEIRELLIKTKPKLKDATTKDETITRDLHKIASLAQAFTEQRLKSNKKSQLSDFLDQEGVSLWNASGVVRQGSAPDSRVVVAALRLAGFRLMEAGLEPKPDTEALLHILQIASKTGATLSELGHNDAASSVLGCAAKYEEALRNIDDPSGTNQQARACVTTVYLSTRMEAAWREGNEGLAAFMADKITENDGRLVLLSNHDRETLATKLLDIGKSLLRSCYQDSKSAPEEGKANEAIRWMQKAFSVIEPLDCATNAELAELKRSVLRSLARGYFLSSSQDPENLIRAETALEEVIATIDPSVNNVSSEYQQLRWMKLAVIKRRKAGDTVLLQALQAIIDNLTYSESNLTDVLQELRTLSQYHQLVTSATQYCLHRALQCSWSTDAVERLLISLIFHCSKDDKHDRAIQDLHTSFKEVCDVEFELLKAPATACITLLWQYGDRHYHAGRWKEAADWFSCGTHSIFTSLGPVSSSKCFRKAALAHLKRKDYAHAGSIIRRCPDTEATTQYVTFLIAVYQGLEDEAIKSIRNMVHAVNFDRKMILLACRLAHDLDMKNLLLNVLKALLETMNFRENVENITEAMTLVRCIIRLIVKLLGEPAADLDRLVAALLHHLKIAATVAESCEQPAMLARDVSWLWRTAYNCAIQACSDWEDREDQISDIFDAARRLLELYTLHATVDVDQAIYIYLVNASFASASGRVMSFRRLRSQTEAIESEKYRDLFNEINQSLQRIGKVLREEKDASRSDRDSLETIPLSAHDFFNVTPSGRTKTVPYTVDIIFDFTIKLILAKLVLFAALEATLHACLSRGHFSLEKFARADRSKAIGYVDQAIAVLEEHGDARDGGDLLYPLDERQWLLSTAYNTGLECLHASMVDEAKRWFECSTIICRFVPDGRQRAEKRPPSTLPD
ncbi:meiosis protein SPO22/ZIP4 like-domain-containing protein [Suillus placidus]|uniref:Meiosis protein SPO22/ZIP4 like-domain-containing protein n=1 Tax=Suillus placidus TaxID=48579 RepID=A0A9P7D128_9AGAM|nr:meiosis protein SPO22/ZIP4 like-domain-containing protein [Suillus placidus]